VVYISKVYTKSGDKGQTMLASGDMVSKDAQRIRAYGDIDEVNSVIGMIRVELARDPKAVAADVFIQELDVQLGRIQQELFNLGAELSTPGVTDHDDKLKVEARHVEALEKNIDHWNDTLDPLKSFILPGGGPTAAACHLGRTVCRRAEREIVALAKDEDVRVQAAIYVNRLSDYLFVIARAVSHRLGYDEVLWDPKST
jgi:cob(I)alamin adenosyltransferase